MHISHCCAVTHAVSVLWLTDQLCNLCTHAQIFCESLLCADSDKTQLGWEVKPESQVDEVCVWLVLVDGSIVARVSVRMVDKLISVHHTATCTKRHDLYWYFCSWSLSVSNRYVLAYLCIAWMYPTSSLYCLMVVVVVTPCSVFITCHDTCLA